MLIFFFNDTATTEIYTLSLHDALPISVRRMAGLVGHGFVGLLEVRALEQLLHSEGVVGVALEEELYLVEVVFGPDRKSTRLNSSHANISYAVFCLKKKKTI